jgi:hypothetical protein
LVTLRENAGDRNHGAAAMIDRSVAIESASFAQRQQPEKEAHEEQQKDMKNCNQ